MENKGGTYLLDSADSFEYLPFLFQIYKQYLLLCGRDNIIAVGAKDQDGKPCGLMLAITSLDKKGSTGENWWLLSVYVSEEKRRMGHGRRLWEQLRENLKKRGCHEISTQGVLRETNLEPLESYYSAMGFSAPSRIAKIFSFSTETIMRSPFVTGSLADAFRPDDSFHFVSFDKLSDAHLMELETNEGNWYPPFVSPLIGKEQFNKTCTIFALDRSKNKIAGWITAMDVNNGKRILYRTFFTREEYRDTPVGFFLFTQAIKNHLSEFIDRGGISSIPTDNDRAMRFSELFFRDAYEHISYEIKSTYRF